MMEKKKKMKFKKGRDSPARRKMEAPARGHRQRPRERGEALEVPERWTPPLLRENGSTKTNYQRENRRFPAGFQGIFKSDHLAENPAPASARLVNR